MGEIVTRGPSVCQGYYQEPELTAAAFKQGPDGEVWLHTGDLGIADADGVVRFTGLCKPMFTRNGFNVYPREVERVLGTLPGVRAVSVTGEPDPASEHEVAATVTGSVSEADVKAWAEAHLSAYKRPTRLTIVPG